MNMAPATTKQDVIITGASHAFPLLSSIFSVEGIKNPDT